MVSFFYSVEDIVGKGENAGYKHFLLFIQCFQKSSLPGSLKVGTVWVKSKYDMIVLCLNEVAQYCFTNVTISNFNVFFNECYMGAQYCAKEHPCLTISNVNVFFNE